MNAVDTMYRSAMSLEAEFSKKGLSLSDLQPETIVHDYHLDISVKDNSSHNNVARVKLFPVLIGEKQRFSNHKLRNVNTGRIDMYLFSTDEVGNLSCMLPRFLIVGHNEGKIEKKRIEGFFIEITKGSEYEIIEYYHDLTDVPSLTFSLTRLLDLSEKGYYAGDLHHHSIYSSPTFGGTDDVIEWPIEVRNHMVGAGLSFGALSDHHNILNHSKWMETATEDFLPIVSKEISTSNGHVMALNVYDDVIYNIPENKDRTKEYLLGEFIRICKQIKENGGLPQINHPRDMNPAISLSSEMTEHIELFETIEIWNGSIPMIEGTTNDQAFKLWLRLLNEDHYIAATTGSDTHNTSANDYHHLFEELQWFLFQLKSGIEFIENKENLIHHIANAESLIELFEKNRDNFEQWSKFSLGSGCVRTYVHIPEDQLLSQKAVLKGLREGRSFLTNGPILIPRIKNCSFGDTYVLPTEEDVFTLTIECFTNTELSQLQLITKSGVLDTKKLNVRSNVMHVLQYPLHVRDFLHKDYLVLVAKSNHINLVITNPIFIRKEDVV